MDNYNVCVLVEDEHIEKGKRVRDDKARRIYEDPIALAINKCLKPQYHAAVCKERSNVISIEYSDRNIVQYMIPITQEIADFINKFDRGEDVESFVFVLLRLHERMIKF